MKRLLGALVLLVVLVAAAPADAHTKVFESRIKQTSIAVSGGDTVDKIGGVVRSTKLQCEIGRKVVVTFLDEDFEVEEYGTTFTNDAGYWEVDDSGPTFRQYRFLVRRSTFVAGTHSHVCESDRQFKTLT